MRGGVLAGAAAGPSCWGVVSWGVAIEGRQGDWPRQGWCPRENFAPRLCCLSADPPRCGPAAVRHMRVRSRSLQLESERASPYAQHNACTRQARQPGPLEGDGAEWRLQRPSEQNRESVGRVLFPPPCRAPLYTHRMCTRARARALCPVSPHSLACSLVLARRLALRNTLLPTLLAGVPPRYSAPRAASNGDALCRAVSCCTPAHMPVLLA